MIHDELTARIIARASEELKKVATSFMLEDNETTWRRFKDEASKILADLSIRRFPPDIEVGEVTEGPDNSLIVNMLLRGEAARQYLEAQNVPIDEVIKIDISLKP